MSLFQKAKTAFLRKWRDSFQYEKDWSDLAHNARYQPPVSLSSNALVAYHQMRRKVLEDMKESMTVSVSYISFDGLTIHDIVALQRIFIDHDNDMPYAIKEVKIEVPETLDESSLVAFTFFW